MCGHQFQKSWSFKFGEEILHVVALIICNKMCEIMKISDYIYLHVTHHLEFIYKHYASVFALQNPLFYTQNICTCLYVPLRG